MAWRRSFRETIITARATSHTVLTAPTIVSGDLLTMILVIENGNDVSSTPTGWTNQIESLRSSQARIIVFTKTAGGSESDITVSLGVSSTINAIVMAHADADTTTPIDVSATSNDNAAPSAPALTSASTLVNTYHIVATGQSMSPSTPANHALLGFKKGVGSVACTYIAVEGFTVGGGSVSAITIPSDDSTWSYAGLSFSIADSGSDRIPGALASGGITVLSEEIGLSNPSTSTTMDSTQTINGIDVFSQASNPASSTNSGLFPPNYLHLCRSGSTTDYRGVDWPTWTAISFAVANYRTFGIHVRLSSPGDFNNEMLVEEDAMAVVLHDTDGDWRAWGIGGQNQSNDPREWAAYTFDPNASGLDDGGTFDVTTIVKASTLNRATTTVNLGVARLFYADPFVMVGGWSGRPLTLSDVTEICVGSTCLINQEVGPSQFRIDTPITVGNNSDATYFEMENFSVAFAALASKVARLLTHHSATGHNGLVFNLSATDTAILTNGSIGSTHPWRFDATIATGGTYTATGIVFAGAGTFDVTGAATFMSCVFADLQASANLDGSTVTNCTFSGAVGAAVEWDDDTTLTNNTFTNNDIGIRVTSAGSKTITLDGDTFSGSVTADVEYTGTGTLTVNLTNGANPTTKSTPGGGTITYVNTVVLTFEGIVSGSRLYVEAGATGPETPGTELANEVVTLDPHTVNYAFTSNQSIIYRVRKGTSSPYYRPLNGSGTITSSGFSVVISQESDE